MTAKIRLFAAVALLLLLASGIWTYSWRGMETAEQNFDRLLSSYEQLAAVRRLHVIFSLELLSEELILSKPDVDGPPASIRAEGEALLLELVDSVQAELALTRSETARQQAMEELADLRQVQESFTAISLWYRQQADVTGSPETVSSGSEFLPLWRKFNTALTLFERRELAEARDALAVIADVPSRLGLLLSLTGSATLLALVIGLYRIWLQQVQLERTVSERTQELEQTADALRVADQNRKLFFAKVGHELRTPLTVVLSEADTALYAMDDPARQQQALANIRLQGSQLARRINDLLALSRSEAGELVLSLAPCEVAAVIDRCCHLIKPYADLRDLQVEQIYETDRDTEVLADAEWLGNAITALLDNAIKVSSSGKTVAVVVSREGAWVRIEVLDTGPGIPEASIKDLLRPYRRVEKGEDYVGSGLGLATASWVINQHSGQLSLANRDSGGLCVRIELPAT